MSLDTREGMLGEAQGCAALELGQPKDARLGVARLRQRRDRPWNGAKAASSSAEASSAVHRLHRPAKRRDLDESQANMSHDCLALPEEPVLHIGSEHVHTRTTEANAPTSTKPNPMPSSPSTPSASLSNPAASPATPDSFTP